MGPFFILNMVHFKGGGVDILFCMVEIHVYVSGFYFLYFLNQRNLKTYHYERYKMAFGFTKIF